MSNFMWTQEVSIELSRENIIYRGVMNPMKATIEGVDCKSVYLKSIDAVIDKNGCDFSIIINSEIKEVTIEVYKLQKQDTLFIENKKFRVKDIPFYFTVAGVSGGNIKLEMFKQIVSLGSFLTYNSYACVDFPISEFKMIILRDNDILGLSQNIGSKSSIETKALIEKIQVGDNVYFIDIKSEILDKVFELETVKFVIE